MIEFDPGSFKDPAGRVFYHGSSIFRTLSDEAHRAFIDARTSGLVAELINQQLLIDTELVSTADAGLPATLGQAVLKQRRIPVVTYAYEWSFEMLRDAALVTLRILDRALAVGFVLKDATAFNILFDGTIPKLVDVPSIEPYREGEIWAGYSQFCRSFLFPLLVSAYRDIDIQPLLRGTLGELPVSDTARLLGPRHWAKPGVLKDVVLQARLDRTFARAAHTVKSATSTHLYPKPVLVASIRRLLRLIEGLKAPASQSQWSAYDTFHTYTDADRQTKLSIVETLADQGKGGRLVDLGCNTGEYSLIATRNGAHVVALDMDSRAIDRLYRKASPAPTVSPVVATLLNPTPAMGWGLRERRSLFERLAADRFLALALVHHLRITGGVPISSIVAQLFAIAAEGIVEWVDKEDAMVQAMLSLRPDVYADYTWNAFEEAIRTHGEILQVRATHEGRRRLCYVRGRVDRPTAAGN